MKQRSLESIIKEVLNDINIDDDKRVSINKHSRSPHICYYTAAVTRFVSKMNRSVFWQCQENLCKNRFVQSHLGNSRNNICIIK